MVVLTGDLVLNNRHLVKNEGQKRQYLIFSCRSRQIIVERTSIMELEMINLSKQFRKKEAVKNINARLTPGVWGLLGANGAGKTTMMRMMAGIMEPTNGKVTFCGKDIRNNRMYRAVFGFLPQEIQFSKDLTVNDYLNYVAALKNVDPDLTKNRISELLAILTLENVRNKKIVKLSGGMKRRVGIAQAMLNDPSVLILDEPTAGLDPGERIRFRNFLSATSTDKIIILSTHIVSDIEDIADHVMIMKDGELNKTVSRNEYEDLEKLYISDLVQIQVDPATTDEYVEFHVRKITDDVSRFAEIIEKSDSILIGTDQYDRIVIIDPDEIVAIHAEKKWCRIFTDTADFNCRKRLYEMEDHLGPDFMRIPKSIVVNIRKIKSVEAVFNGMMLLHMKNGSKEYVSRTYLPDLKSFLGI